MELRRTHVEESVLWEGLRESSAYMGRNLVTKKVTHFQMDRHSWIISRYCRAGGGLGKARRINNRVTFII
jgi:hypothetical protein